MKKDGVGVTMIVGLPKPGKKGPCPMCGDKKCDGSCMDDEEYEDLEDEEEMDDFAEEDAEDDMEDEELEMPTLADMEDEEEMGGLEEIGVEAADIIAAVKDEDPVAFESSLKALFTRWYEEMNA